MSLRRLPMISSIASNCSDTMKGYLRLSKNLRYLRKRNVSKIKAIWNPFVYPKHDYWSSLSGCAAILWGSLGVAFQGMPTTLRSSLSSTRGEKTEFCCWSLLPLLSDTQPHWEALTLQQHQACCTLADFMSLWRAVTNHWSWCLIPHWQFWAGTTELHCWF